MPVPNMFTGVLLFPTLATREKIDSRVILLQLRKACSKAKGGPFLVVLCNSPLVSNWRDQEVPRNYDDREAQSQIQGRLCVGEILLCACEREGLVAHLDLRILPRKGPKLETMTENHLESIRVAPDKKKNLQW